MSKMNQAFTIRADTVVRADTFILPKDIIITASGDGKVIINEGGTRCFVTNEIKELRAQVEELKQSITEINHYLYSPDGPIGKATIKSLYARVSK